MSNEKHNDGNEDSWDNSEPSTSRSDNIISSSSQEPESKESGPHNKEPEPESNKEGPSIKTENQREAKTANTISIMALFINMALAILTYMLFMKTQEANKTANDGIVEARRANDISARSLEYSRIKDSISDIREGEAYLLAKKDFEIRTKKDSLSIEYSGKSLAAQINSFETAQEQFSKENEANLQFDDFKIYPDTINKKIILHYRLQNLGKQPAKIVSWRGLNKTFGHEKHPPAFLISTFRMAINNMSWYQEEKYVTGQQFEEETFDYPGSKEEFKNMIRNPEMFIYFGGEVQFQNLITKKVKKYSYLVKGYFRTPTGFKYLINDNVEIP